MAKQSTQQRIDALNADITKKQALVAELTAKLAAGDVLDGVVVGQSIQFVYGRGENRKTYSGTVLAIGDTAAGPRIKVQAGEGFDVNLYVIDASAIQVPEELRTAPAEQTATETPVAGTTVVAEPTAAQAAHEAAVSEAADVDPAAAAAQDPMAGV